MIYKIYTDGGSRGNPGPAACALVVYTSTLGRSAEILQDKRGKYLGLATNNEAEYQGVIEAYAWLQENLASATDLRLEFLLDSTLVVNQLNGLFKVKEPRIEKLISKIDSLKNGLRNRQTSFAVSYTYVPRVNNWQADLLVNETLDKAAKS